MRTKTKSKYKTVGFGRIIASLAQVLRLCFDRKFKISKLLIIKNMEREKKWIWKGFECADLMIEIIIN